MRKSGLCLLALLFPVLLMAEVTVSVKPNDKALSFKWENNSEIPYFLGGVRFYTDGYVHSKLKDMTDWSFSQQDVNGETEQTLLYDGSLSSVTAVNVGGNVGASTLGDYTGKPVEGAKRAELLLKTGSEGQIEQPDDEDPITIDQLDSVMNLPTYYDEDHRYLDTLGANGGTYAGGIMDTWLGRTQMQIALSGKSFPIHKTDNLTFGSSGKDHLYWMSVAMGQEYFQVDQQWMLGKAMQETSGQGGTTAEGAFGVWEVETFTGKSRETAYPYFFENGTIEGFWNDATSNNWNPNVVNAYIYSIVCVRYTYDLYMYSTNICWKEILTEAQDRYYPISLMLVGYNRGVNAANSALTPKFLRSDVYDQNGYLTSEDMYREVELAVEAAGTYDYASGTVSAVKNLEDASRAALTDKSIEILDMDISFEKLQEFFYGDGGTVSTQGDGGLLGHFDIDREAFDSVLTEAFNILKGKAPSTQGEENISLRYDFLTLLRTVKHNFQITWVRPTGPDEFKIWVQGNSNPSFETCAGPEVDTLYPYGEISGAPEFVDDFVVDIHGRDNQMVEEIVWTMNPAWKKWNKATYKSGSDGDQIFTITIPREDIKAQFGDNTGTYWYMVTDASGNSVVKKDIIKGNPIKYAAAIDNNGDGFTDSIKVQIVEGALEDGETVGGYDELKYSWPTKDNLTKTTGVDVDGEFVYINSLSDDAGAGLGQVTVKYPSMSDAAERDIVDSVGPAVTYATLFEGLSEDTLKIVPSEKVDNIGSKDYEYLYLIKGSDETKEQSKEVVSVSNGDTLLFLFEKNIVSDKDSVRFIYDCELTDRAGVKPQSNNVRKPIKKNGSLEPELDSTIAVDTKGDGMADLITIHFTPSTYSGALGLDQHQNLKYSWPTKDNLVEPDDAVVDGSNLKLTDAALTGGSGLGKIEFSFGAANFDGNIDDRVGPAITKAICMQQDGSRPYDTLTLSITESLKENFSEQKYLIIFNDSSDTEGDTVVVKEVKTNGSNYDFIIDLNQVTYGNWVQFNAGSGIEDNSGNEPLTINQKEQVNVLGGIVPFISTAEIFDVRGTQNSRINGHGDSIFVELTLADDPKALTVDSLKKISYTWGGTTNSIKKNEITAINETSFAIINESLQGGSGEGDLTLTFGDANVKVEAKIKDRVAPVIRKAEYFNWNSVKDTLIITFSEDVSKSGSNKPFSVMGDAITVLEQSTDGATVTYSIENGVNLSYDDSIWVSANEEIIDAASNEQDTDNNERVPLSYKHITEIVDAAYYESDERPNGYIDVIRLFSAASLDNVSDDDIDAIRDALTLPAERFLTIDTVEKEDNETIIVRVKQSQSDASALTSEQPYDKLAMSMVTLSDTLAFAQKSDLPIKDSLAPVIVSARFLPAGDDEDPLIDTLKVTYSEEVRSTTNDEPFRFRDASSNDEYSLSFDNDNGGTSDVIYTNEYNQSNVLPDAGDSVWIYESGDIEDAQGLVQEKNTIPVPLTVGQYKRNYKVSITPTPFNLEYYEDSVVTIRIQPRTRMLPSDIQAEFIMYDKVGNIVKEVSADQFGEVEDEMLKYSFKPQNATGRKLGWGSYAIQLRITTGGVSVIEPLFLALQKRAIEENE